MGPGYWVMSEKVYLEPLVLQAVIDEFWPRVYLLYA